MSDATTQTKPGPTWVSYFLGKDKENPVGNESDEKNSTETHQGVDPVQEVSTEKKDLDYKSLYEEKMRQFDKQAKAIEISKRTSKENQKLKSQLENSKLRLHELEGKVETAEDVDSMVDLKFKIEKETIHQQELKAEEQRQRNMMNEINETTEIREEKLTGFHSLDLTSAIKQQADLMGLSPEEGDIQRLISEPERLGKSSTVSFYLIAMKDKEIADMKKEIESLKIKHSDPQLTAIQTQSNNHAYNDDYNNNTTSTGGRDPYLMAASMPMSQLERALKKQ
ncbi:hypothetical protein CL634_10610 [bacterium]|nr:hypothetical protein [bacterium]